MVELPQHRQPSACSTIAGSTYLSSLNHCIWFHRPFSPDDWMHVETESPCAQGGRGLSIARVHDRTGAMIATTAQETLMAHSVSP
ncbi:acyl-CoA thioesterase [Bradyrhizobium cenepequi]